MTAALFAPDQRGLTISCMALMASASYNNLSVAAAMPSIGDSLGNLEFLPWVITIELIAAAIAVLAVGPVIDVVGPRTIYRYVIVAFAATSALCAAAPSMFVLIVARGLQGLAAGAMIANVMAAIGLGVPPLLRARAYAANSAVWGVMGVGGPAIAASLLAVFDWPAIFLVNVPVALVVGIVGWNAFPEAGGERASIRPDRVGLALVVAFTFLSLGALSTIAWWTPIALVASFGAVFAYVRHERGEAHPVVRMRHLRAPELRWLHVSAILVLAAGIGSHAFLPVYMKGVRGASTGEAAFSIVFFVVGWTTGSFAASRIQDFHRGERVILGASFLLVAATGAVALGVGLDWPLPIVFAAYFAVGASLGGAASSGLSTLNLKAEPTVMGRVNSAHQFIRTLGFTYGTALAGAILFSVVAFELGDADAVRELLGEDTLELDAAGIDALRSGYTWAAVASFIVAVLAVLAALQLDRGSRRSVEEPVFVPSQHPQDLDEEPGRPGTAGA